ncbi:hypothetical protein BLNAU_10670 [Blattamonas nauphoetae]|uniref:Uncharacterized protein n=1 Tax=Blattamonas nauphoetae TaxID=2049346 RepID=A0ABQ9XPL1_9EUKA|nr:hypothetical protein BLNAU_10670 [Blattamonas nauphoetae]
MIVESVEEKKDDEAEAVPKIEAYSFESEDQSESTPPRPILTVPSVRLSSSFSCLLQVQKCIVVHGLLNSVIVMSSRIDGNVVVGDTDAQNEDCWRIFLAEIPFARQDGTDSLESAEIPINQSALMMELLNSAGFHDDCVVFSCTSDGGCVRHVNRILEVWAECCPSTNERDNDCRNDGKLGGRTTEHLSDQSNKSNQPEFEPHTSLRSRPQIFFGLTITTYPFIVTMNFNESTIPICMEGDTEGIDLIKHKQNKNSAGVVAALLDYRSMTYSSPHPFPQLPESPVYHSDNITSLSLPYHHSYSLIPSEWLEYNSEERKSTPRREKAC